MKVKKLSDIDISQYKIAHVETNIMENDTLCHEEVMAMADGGITDEKVTMVLIPKDKRLAWCGGDDWNDAPAEHNASGFYEYPKGTIFLSGKLGEELTLEDRESGLKCIN